MPQVQDAPDAGTEFGNIMDDLWASLGSALRDVERMRVQLANDINVDFGRLRSAFNCQNVGQETLSAEQIYVEHIIEQTKGAFATCAAPDGSDVQEVIITDAPGDISNADSTVVVGDVADTSGDVVAIDEALPNRSDDCNLLDLSESPTVLEKNDGKQAKNLKEVTECWSDIDLLDLAEPTSVNEVNFPPHSSTEAEVHINSSIEEKGTSTHEEDLINMDLLDVAPLPAVNTAMPVAQVH